MLDEFWSLTPSEFAFIVKIKIELKNDEYREKLKDQMRQSYYNQILSRTKKLKDLNYYLKNIDKAIDKALKEIEKENNKKVKDKDISNDEIKKLALHFGIKSPN